MAIDERQGDQYDQYGWAVDYGTPAVARSAAPSECGFDCAMIFNWRGAYAADHDGANGAMRAACDSPGGARSEDKE